MVEKLKNLTYGQAVIAGIIVSALYYFSMYNNGAVQTASIAKLEQEIKKQEDEIKAVEKALEDAKRFQETMAVLGAEMERVLKALPEKLSSVELMRNMSNEAKTVGASINQLSLPQAFRPTDKKKSSVELFYEEVITNVDLTGSYNQIMLFLSNLTRSEKIITVKELKLADIAKAEKGAQPQPVINMKGVFAAYKYVPKSVEAEATKPKPAAKKSARKAEDK